MNKKMEKNYFIESATLELFKSEYGIRFSNCTLRTEADDKCKSKITISWEEPEKTVSISESQWDEHYEKWHATPDTGGFYYYVKEIIFGGEK